MQLIPDESWAALTIWMEARGEGWEGMCAVGEVIRARMSRRYASDGTVPGTVLAPYQFSGWNTQDANRIDAALADADDSALRQALVAWRASEYTDYAEGAVLYHAASMESAPSWASAPSVRRITQIGNHIFYAETSDGEA